MSDFDQEWPYLRPDKDGSSLGISFSGGGIRSAAFCLGAYQHLAREQVFQKAEYLSGVSGGSYIACALTVSQGESDESTLRGSNPPWSRGSVEERYLRNHLAYLAPGLLGRLWLIVNYTYGFILNLVPLVAASYLLGKVLGFLYAGFFPGLGSSSFDLWRRLSPGLWASVSVLAFAVSIVGVRRFFDKSKYPRIYGARGLRLAATTAVALSLTILIVAVLTPLVSHLLGIALEHVRFWRGRPEDFTLRRAFAGLLMLLFVMLLGAVAVFLVQRGRGRLLQGMLAFAGGWGTLAIPFVLATQGTARRGWNGVPDVIYLLASASALVVCGLFVHNRRYSMHLYYRERLSRVFALRRAPEDQDIAVGPVPYDEEILLSKIGAVIADRRGNGLPFPRTVICAAVAARDGDVPNKSYAASFTFEAERSGSPELGPLIPTTVVEAPNSKLQDAVTLPGMMAISGAAISPTMGRFTLPSFRLLMALMNLRLGVWLPNRFGPADQGHQAAPVSRRGRLLRQLTAGWREPGGLYVMKEALGLAGTKGKFIHVSDGGHWENLGLVELIRRRCTHIIVIDASAGGRDPLQDIARAASLARSELGAEVVLDPSATAPTGGHELAAGPVAIGTVEYPDGTVGVISYGRCVLWSRAPMDLQVFQRTDPQFPKHPTANQLFSGEQFDAYRALGWAVAEELLTKASLPLEEFATAGPSDGLAPGRIIV